MRALKRASWNSVEKKHDRRGSIHMEIALNLKKKLCRTTAIMSTFL